jgi:hypothetical protein
MEQEPVSALVGNLSAAQQRLERDAVEMREHLKATVLDAVMPDDYQPPTYPEVIEFFPHWHNLHVKPVPNQS